MDFETRAQMPKDVKGANFIALVRRKWNSVGQEK
jgi:hypothetical protein